MKRSLPIIAGASFGLAFVMFFCQPTEVHAQAELMWLDVGEYHFRYASTGTEPSGKVHRANMIFWPGIYESEGGTHVRNFQYIGVKDFTDENGDPWAFKVARTGPRVVDMGEHFATEMELVGRFEKPEIFVDGFQTFPRPTVVNRVDPSIKSDRMIRRGAHTTVGLTWEEKIYAFSNPYHDDYHIREMTWTNTGNVDDDEELELEGQTLKDVMFFFWKESALLGSPWCDKCWCVRHYVGLCGRWQGRCRQVGRYPRVSRLAW